MRSNRSNGVKWGQISGSNRSNGVELMGSNGSNWRVEQVKWGRIMVERIKLYWIEVNFNGPTC